MRYAKQMKIVFASKNPHKFTEVESILSAALQVEELLPLSAFENAPEAEEHGATFVANAEKKAVVYGRWLAQQGHRDYWALAEDAGLEVAALNGFPGVLSSRLAPTDAERMAAVLSRLEAAASSSESARLEEETREEPSWPSEVPSGSRIARFVSAMALAKGGEVIVTVVGAVCGFIAEEPRGESGFGYDPVFYYPPYGRTFGECTLEEKRAVSHRSRALAAILVKLKESNNS